jgi:hypothetical protein
MRREILLEDRARSILYLDSAAADRDSLVRIGFLILSDKGEKWKARLEALEKGRVHDRALLTQTRRWLAKVEALLRPVKPAPGTVKQ